MYKEDLIKALKNIKGNPQIFLHCSYNNYEIRHVVNRGDCIILPVGDPCNQNEIDFEPDVA